MNQKNNEKIIFIFVGVIGVILILCLLYVSAFAKKTLVCKLTQDDVIVNLSTEFKGDKISKANIVIEFDISKYISYKETFVTKIEKEYLTDKYKDMNVKITSDDTKIYVNMKASKDNFEKVGFGMAGTYEEVSKDLKRQGFICK